MFKIYIITNTINTKKYVGQTKRSLKLRFKEHARANSIIGKAIRKYHIDNFQIQKITTATTQEQANEMEEFYVKEYDCFSHGYNCTNNGRLDNYINDAWVIDFKNKKDKLWFVEQNTTIIGYITKIINKAKCNTQNDFELFLNHKTQIKTWKLLWEGISCKGTRTQKALKIILINNNLLYKNKDGLYLNKDKFMKYYDL